MRKEGSGIKRQMRENQAAIEGSQSKSQTIRGNVDHRKVARIEIGGPTSPKNIQTNALARTVVSSSGTIAAEICGLKPGRIYPIIDRQKEVHKSQPEDNTPVTVVRQRNKTIGHAVQMVFE